MDAVLTAALGAGPQLGVGGVLLALLVVLVRRETQDRADYRSALAEQATRHAAELKRITESHDAELVELRREIAGLRDQLHEVNTKLDGERERRRAAEDRAANPRREPPQ